MNIKEKIQKKIDDIDAESKLINNPMVPIDNHYTTHREIERAVLCEINRELEKI